MWHSRAFSVHAETRTRADGAFVFRPQIPVRFLSQQPGPVASNRPLLGKRARTAVTVPLKPVLSGFLRLSQAQDSP